MGEKLNNYILEIDDWFKNAKQINDVGKLESKIQNCVDELHNLSKNYRIYENLTHSLQSRLLYIKKRIKEKKLYFSKIEEKWKNIKSLYNNFMYFSKYHDEINSNFYCNNNCEKDDKVKRVFAVGLVNLENDNIKVYEEIKEILELASGTNYYVYPIVGCTIKSFKTKIKEFDFDIIHIAGHTSKRYNLLFDGQGVSATRFKKIFIDQKKSNHKKMLLIYNCCHSEKFYNNCKEVSNKSITYDDLLHPDTAFDFAKCFFQNIFMDKNPYISYRNAKQNNEHYIYHK